MNRQEFIDACSAMGYCSKQTAKKYAGDREDFTDEDFVEAYRLSERLDVEHWESGQKKRPLGDGGYTTKHYTVYNGHDEH